MAIISTGQLQQYTGPFNNTDSINVGKFLTRLGISVNEKDYMPYTVNGVQPLLVRINGKEIQIGNTFIYQPGDILQGVNISFPNGAPASTKVDILTIES